MNRLSVFPLLVLCATAAGAATLPLRPGRYVLADTPCQDPPFAATFAYDGRHFSYPHASACRSTILSRSGPRYRVRETCSAQGDGTAAAPSTTVSTYMILSATRVRVGGGAGGETQAYRWCPAR